ncbi:MAG: ATPase, partial [Salinibacter sp.]
MATPTGILSLFRPLDDHLSTGAEREIERHRLLLLFGAVLVLTLGALYDATPPGAVTWPEGRLAVAGLFVALFGLSYTTEAVRRHITLLMQGTLYVLMGWFSFVAARNGFAGDYDMGVLLLYAILPGMVATGARRMRAVLWFLGVGFAMGTVGALLGPVPLPKALSVLASLATMALVEGIAIQVYLLAQAQLREREERIQGLANSLPGVVFQAYFRPDGSSGSYFVSDHAESLLGISSAPNDFHDRFVDQIPDEHRKAFLDSIDAAVEREDAWRQEVPFETPSGERRWLLCASTPQRRDDELI